ncbi:MAG: pentapeptide repeat-containing protein [Candidatus Melainabacteria bacterium]|nr:pentapeptide repeat-containing protein [Candidatus Melainabacteria bacterium]
MSLFTVSFSGQSPSQQVARFETTGQARDLKNTHDDRALAALFEPITASPASTPDILNGSLEQGPIRNLDEFKLAVQIAAATSKPLQLAQMSFAEITAALQKEGYQGDSFDYIKEKLGAKGFRKALSDADLSGADLTGLDLSSKLGPLKRIQAIDLTGTILNEANLSGITFRQAKFIGTKLKQADLSKAQFDDMLFENVDLGGANCEQCLFDHASFENSTMKAINLQGSSFRELGGTEFKNTDMSGACLEAVRFKDDALFESCVMDEVNMRNSNTHYSNAVIRIKSKSSLKGIDFSGSCFGSLSIEGQTDQRIDCSGLKAEQVSAKSSVSTLVSFQHANLDNSRISLDTSRQTPCLIRLENCSAQEAHLDFAGDDDTSLIFEEVDLSKAQLKNISQSDQYPKHNFKQVNFTRTNMENCDLSKAEFSGCTIPRRQEQPVLYASSFPAFVRWQQ